MVSDFGQGDLFDPHESARRTDPQTSHESARKAVSFAASHAGRCLGAIEAAGLHGANASQISEAVDLLPHQVTKRLNDLRKDGLIMTTGETRRNATGRSERVWVTT